MPEPAERTDRYLPSTPPEHLIRDFVSRGLVIVAPEDLGVPTDLHETIYRNEIELLAGRKRVTATSVPEILDVIRAPGLVAACNALVGKNWAIVPFTHNTPFASGGHDQHWHKDDNGPYNMRRHRHHHAVQVEMLYYPQAVEPDMGPTATLPYSQYWTFNHEENHDNFAGADHLDFAYQLGGMERTPASGPKCSYPEADVVARRTPHDQRMRDAVTKTGWPLLKQFEAAPLAAGTVILYSHNLFHRGNHRRDDWRHWKSKPRFMWRFWLYRTTDPVDRGDPPDVDWRGLGVDPLTGVDRASASDGTLAVWRHHYHWMHTGRWPRPSAGRASANLNGGLTASGEDQEPTRIGAAYLIAEQPVRRRDRHLFWNTLVNDRESVRRAGLYGGIAAGDAGARTFLGLALDSRKWVQRAAVCGLGDAANLTTDVLQVLRVHLEDIPSVYLRSVAASALGCIGRRALGTGNGIEHIPAIVKLLMRSLKREPNRLGMNIAQGRSIKFVRPTDECDVCEGIGIDYGVPRFKPVRSAVRESALWSLVILCSHGDGPLGDRLPALFDQLTDIARNDDNVFCAGLAVDALARIATAKDIGTGTAIPRSRRLLTLRRLLEDLPIHSWEAFVRSGASPPLRGTDTSRS